MINEGAVDRTARVLGGLFLALSAFLPQTAWWFDGWGPWKYAVTAVGLVLAVTGLVGMCPLYSILRINTGART